ncbi:hypothetical protein GCM10023194_07420 [Planotetraspora phitsanulokensis]|uniref:Carboxypeptidase regulatory-like domain-containing protein n=1 Tax=Planotetraspora phitsanulokensis TaxID=575192 RepID=A0A8J3U5X5_9ACTN|nr:hypothetical protein [Planotetraspora phitsanulokensis]GII39238.1 hypothetical protein Pph01_42410 [Planotetraspora phitsanulokensis]
MRRTLLGLLGVLMAVSLAAPSAHADTTKIRTWIRFTPGVYLTYDRTATVTGTVGTYLPKGGGAPLADQTVLINCSNGGCPFHEVTTDAAGNFTVEVHGDQGIDVTAQVSDTDALEESIATTWIEPKTFAWLEASFSPAAIPPSRTTTLSGRLRYLGRDEVTWKPLPGRTIHIEGAGISTEATTGADGSFSKKVTFPKMPAPAFPMSSVPVEFWWTPTTTIDKTFFDRDATMSADVYPAKVTSIVDFGGLLNPSGTVTLKGGVAGEVNKLPLKIQYSKDGSTNWTDLRTIQAQGPFSTTFTPPAVPAYYRAQIVTADNYLGSTSRVVKVGTSVTSVGGFTASVNANHVATVRGTVGPSGLKVPVRIEYSSNGKTGWHTAKVLTAGGAFSTTLKTPLNTGYYRAEILSAKYYKGSTSRVVKAGRTPTRIAGVKVSATRVKKNTYFTIKGTLQRYLSGWKGFKGQRVRLVFHIKGSKALHLYARPLTGTGGKFTAKIKATREAYWTTTYLGATGYYAYNSPKYIRVTLR